MKFYLTDIIYKIQSFSKKLDNETLLCDQNWVLLDLNSEIKEVWIFRANNTLLVSKNGITNKGKWEFVSKQNILIEQSEMNFLMKHGFLDETILALKLDGSDSYAFFINESMSNSEFNTLEDIILFLSNKYLTNEKSNLPKNEIYIGPNFTYSLKSQVKFMSKVNFYEIIYEDGLIGKIYFESNENFHFKIYDNVWVPIRYTYNNLLDCARGFYYYKKLDKKVFKNGFINAFQ